MASKAKSLGFSKERLARLDRFIAERYLASGRLPCAQLIVARHGEVVHQSVQGMADVERSRPLAEDAIFRIYSMTKPVTSVALMMLVEEGRIALEDPVHRWIPEWRDLGVFTSGGPDAFATKRPDRPMQVVDLMRHTSGLTYGFQNRTNVDAAYRRRKIAELSAHALSLEAMIAELAKLPLEFSPGEAWNYSVSTDVVGYLVQLASGLPFADFLQQRIFDPLGMADTGFHVPAEKAHRLPACYNATPEGGMVLQDDPETSAYLAPPVFYSGGGGLVSTAADYLTFCRALAAGGELSGQRLLAPRTIELMTANHLPGGKDLTDLSRSLFSEETNAGVGFGLGFATVVDPARTLLPGSKGQYYWGGAASTAFWIDPADDLVVIFMTQLTPSTTWPIRRELRTLVYSALTDPGR